MRKGRVVPVSETLVSETMGRWDDPAIDHVYAVLDNLFTHRALDVTPAGRSSIQPACSAFWIESFNTLGRFWKDRFGEEERERGWRTWDGSWRPSAIDSPAIDGRYRPPPKGVHGVGTMLAQERPNAIQLLISVDAHLDQCMPVYQFPPRPLEFVEVIPHAQL